MIDDKKIGNAPGTWDSTEIKILEGETEIGSYVRSYPSYGKNTFFPFEQDGKWYALFSANYTRTQLMALPSCDIIGGEPQVEGEGFCPVEFYVPSYVKFKSSLKSAKHEWYYDADADIDDANTWPAKPERCYEVHSFDFGFVAGCYWGDDWSWKIQHLDLSKASEGIVTRSEKFGYVWLGEHLKLSNSVHIEMESPDDYTIEIAIVKGYNPKKDYSKFDASD